MMNLSDTNPFLDDFRVAYTLNWHGENNSMGPMVISPMTENFGKMAMWIPVISHIVAAILLFRTIKEFNEDEFSTWQEKLDQPTVLKISRCAIALTVPPLLFLIDIVGTAVKYCADARDASKDL